MKDIKVVVFDLDDTLISEYEYIKSGYKVVSTHLSQKYNIEKKLIFNELMNNFVLDSNRVFNLFFENNDIEYFKEDILELVSIYRNHLPNINFYDDVIPILSYLREKGFKLGIITDGYKETQRQKIISLNLNEYIDYIIVTDELGDNQKYWKPHPMSFEYVQKKFKVEFDEILYIGDNVKKDFFIKKSHPVKTVRIKRNNLVIHNSDEYLGDIKEDYRIENLFELEGIFNGDKQ